MIAIAIGIAAAIFSVTSFVPQAWHVIRTRDTAPLVTSMWIMNVIGFALWVSYGGFLGSWPIIVPNVICFALAGFILAMKLRASKAAPAVAP